MALRQVELDKRGLDYVIGHLRGVNHLCDELARVVKNEDGHVFTIVPHGARADHVYDFERGGLLAENLDMSVSVPLGAGQGFLMPVADLAVVRGTVTLEVLDDHPGAICLCDDVNPRWGEEIACSTPDAFGVGEEAYHLLTAGSGLEVVVDTLRFTDTVWHGVAAVCAKPLDIPDHRNVELAALAACARSVIQLTCTAYDGEGFVAWKRNSR